MTGASALTKHMSVVIATRGRSEGCLRLCKELDDQLARHPKVIAEIILVFDGCPAYGWFVASPPYHGIELKVGVGIARARNAGIVAASGAILAFLDDDAVPAAGWISSLLSALDGYPHLVAFGGRVIGSDQNNLYAQLRDQVYYRETFGPWYVDCTDGDLVGPPYVNGGNSAYRRAAVLDAGGFNSTLPAYSDVDLGRRLRLGECGVLVAGMVIHHDHPSTFRQYMLRCYRSGRARGLLWSQHRYRQDGPGRVATTILANIFWNNATRRAGRIKAPRLNVVGVLLCQEVLHGVGYTRSLVSAR